MTDPRYEITNEDCMELMARYPDKHFDLAIVDPPYGIDAGNMQMGSGKHQFRKGLSWDGSIPDGAYFKELFRVSQNQIIWGGNYFTEFLTPSPHWIIWDKRNPNLSFAEGEMAWVRDGKNLRIFHYLSTQPDQDGPKRHITAKPIKLYKWILGNYAKEGDKILDTHGGSMSSVIAALDMGFHITCCELDKEYFEAGKRRVNEYLSQLKLFA